MSAYCFRHILIICRLWCQVAYLSALLVMHLQAVMFGTTWYVAGSKQLHADSSALTYHNTTLYFPGLEDTSVQQALKQLQHCSSDDNEGCSQNLRVAHDVLSSSLEAAGNSIKAMQQVPTNVTACMSAP